MNVRISGPSVDEKSNGSQQRAGNKDRNSKLGLAYPAIPSFELDKEAVVDVTRDCMYAFSVFFNLISTVCA